MHVCVATDLHQKQFLTRLTFFLCTHDTVVTFVPKVNNFKPTITFVYLIMEVQNHLVAKLSPLFGQRCARDPGTRKPDNKFQAIIKFLSSNLKGHFLANAFHGIT